MVIKNKNGWLRIFEATIAIMLILGAIALIYSTQRTAQIEQDTISDWQIEMLRTIADDNDLRNFVVRGNNSKISKFINDSIAPNLDHHIEICNITGTCLANIPDVIGKNVYVQERIISGTLDEYDPKRLRFFVWRKSN